MPRRRRSVGIAGKGTGSGRSVVSPAMSDAVTVVLTLIAGFFTGVLSGMFGVGGAVISTPAILALGATPLQAVGSTLPSIIPGAAAGSVRYEREGMIDHRVAWRTGVAGMAFAALGAVASKAVPGKGHVQMILTALLLGWFAFRTARGSDPAVAPADHELRRGLWLLIVIGVMAGSLSGFLGVGGGIVMVPAFTNWVGLPLKRAIATSLVCVGLVSHPRDDHAPAPRRHRLALRAPADGRPRSRAPASARTSRSARRTARCASRSGACSGRSRSSTASWSSSRSSG